jgi:DNA-binding beta-propeller fold protein YncE
MRFLMVVCISLLLASFDAGGISIPKPFEMPELRGAGAVEWVALDESHIPTADIRGNGSTVAVEWWFGAQPRLATYDFPSGNPRWEASLAGGGTDGAIAVARLTGRIAVLHGNSFNADPTRVSLFEADTAAPVWTQAISGNIFALRFGDSPLDLSADGSLVAVAYSERATSLKFLKVFDGGSGALLWSTQLDGFAVRGVDVSDDGSRIMVGLGDQVKIFAANGDLLGFFVSATCCEGPSLSADGGRAVIRRGANAEMLVWNGAAYEVSWKTNLAPLLAYMVVVSPDGNLVAVYAASQLCEGSNMVLIYKSFLTSPFATYDRYSSGACPSSMKFSQDGTRLVVGTLGSPESQEQPQDVLVDVATVLDTRTPLVATPLFRLLDDIDEKGSVRKVGISDDGKRVVIATKQEHAQVLGLGGRVWAIQILL